MTHGYPIIPDILVVLFCLAWIVKWTTKVKPLEEPALAKVVKTKSVYPIPRGRMS